MMSNVAQCLLSALDDADAGSTEYPRCESSRRVLCCSQYVKPAGALNSSSNLDILTHLACLSGNNFPAVVLCAKPFGVGERPASE
jgi:hypothetical protein